MKKEILIFGASDYASYTIDVLEKQNEYEIYGILDYNTRKDDIFCGYKVLGNDDDLPEIYRNTGIKMGIVTIGDNYRRSEVVERILAYIPDFTFVSAIHPSIILGNNVRIGIGCALMAGVILNNDTIVGNHCYIGTNSSLDHDGKVADFSNVMPGVTTGGNVKIGFCSTLGLGAKVIHGRNIGNHTIIGAGAVVVNDFGDNLLAFGVPAKKIRDRDIGEKYL